MICLNCRRQMPDNATACPYCGNPVDAPRQLTKEISFRRYQRWFFYGVIALIFIGMVVVILRIYNANSNLLISIANVQNDLKKANEDLDSTKNVLDQTKGELATTQSTAEEKQSIIIGLEADLQAKAAELEQKTNEFKEVLDEKVAAETRNQQCSLNLNSADANIYNLIIRLGQGISNDNLVKIKVADANLGGMDTDEDGLSDIVEDSFGTDKTAADTDGDGYSDKQEILSGYNPLGEGKLGIDGNFSNQQKGKILLQVEANGEAWYVAGDGLRYFMGAPADAFRVIRSIDYWIEGYTPIVSETMPVNTTPIATETTTSTAEITQ